MITHFIPYPPHGGSIQRNYNLLKEISRYHEIYYLTFTQKVLMPDEDLLKRSLEELNRFCKAVKVFKIPTDYSKFRWYSLLLRNLFSLTPYSVWKFKSEAMKEEIINITKEINFDILYIDTIALAQYEKTAPSLLKVMNHHNVESSLLLRRSANEKNPLKRLYIYLQGRKLKRYEKIMTSRFDLNIMVSKLDKIEMQQYAGGTQFDVITNGTDIEYFKPEDKIPAKELIFAGGMTWYPNKDAMIYFCKEIFPLIQKKDPDVIMNVIGSHPPAEIVKMSKTNRAIAIHGFVDDVRPYLSRSAVYVVPIRVGGGTRLKILDAFAAGKAVVSTSIGYEGIDVTPGENILTGDSPEEFAEQVSKVLNDEPLRKKLEVNARKTAVEKYSWQIIGKTLNEAYLKLAV